jgi:hypothetical protein
MDKAFPAVTTARNRPSYPRGYQLCRCDSDRGDINEPARLPDTSAKNRYIGKTNHQRHQLTNSARKPLLGLGFAVGGSVGGAHICHQQLSQPRAAQWLLDLSQTNAFQALVMVAFETRVAQVKLHLACR